MDDIESAQEDSYNGLITSYLDSISLIVHSLNSSMMLTKWTLKELSSGWEPIIYAT